MFVFEGSTNSGFLQLGPGTSGSMTCAGCTWLSPLERYHRSPSANLLFPSVCHWITREGRWHTANTAINQANVNHVDNRNPTWGTPALGTDACKRVHWAEWEANIRSTQRIPSTVLNGTHRKLCASMSTPWKGNNA